MQKKGMNFLIGTLFLVLLISGVFAQVPFNPSNPINGAVVSDPLLILNISTSGMIVPEQYHVLLNDYYKFQVGQMWINPVSPQLTYPNIIKAFTTNLLFKNNIVSDSPVSANEPIFRIAGNLWEKGNDITKKEYTASNNIYYRENTDYLFYDGLNSDYYGPIRYSYTNNLNQWMSDSGETGSIIPSSPSTLLNIIENPTLPKNNPSSYFRTASSEANSLGAGAEWDMTQEPWITWFPESCSPEDSQTPCTKDDYDGVHNGQRTCVNGKWSECKDFTDYDETEICAGAALDGNHCFFIDPINGNDANLGTMASPWRTLNTVFNIEAVSPTKKNLASISGQKTVVLRNGTFNICQAGNNALCIDIGASTANLIVRNYPGEEVKIVAPTNDMWANPQLVFRVGSAYLSPVHDVIFDGLDIQGGSYYVFKFNENVHDVTIRNCKLHDSGIDTIKFSGGYWAVGEGYVVNYNNVIENSEIYHSSKANLEDPSRVPYLSFTHNDEGIDAMGTGWVTIRNNYFHDITGSCLYLKGGSWHSIVENNFCLDSGLANVNVSDVSIMWGNSFSDPLKIFDIYSGGTWMDIDSSYIYDFSGEYSEYSKSTLSSALDGTGIWSRYVLSPNQNEWFILDLGSSRNIERLRGRSNIRGDPTSVDVYVSDTLGNWGTPVASGISKWKNNVSWDEVDNTDKVGRYVLVNVTQVETMSLGDIWGGIWLGEWEDAAWDWPYPNYYSNVNGTVRNNVIAYSHGNSLRAAGAKDPKFYSNTIYNPNRESVKWGTTYGGGFAITSPATIYTQYAQENIKKDGTYWYSSLNVTLNWDGVDKPGFATWASTIYEPYSEGVFIYPEGTNDWQSMINMTPGTHNYYVKVTDNLGVTHQSETRTITYAPTAPEDCVIDNAYWTPTSTLEGVSVDLILEGTSCSGQEFNFTVMEDDWIWGDDNVVVEPVNAFFSGDTLATTWNAEWSYDGFLDPNPEYYFVATQVNYPSNSITSNDPKLDVQKIITDNKIYIEPASQTVTEGDQVTIEIKGQAPIVASDVYAIEYDLTYDPSLLSVSSVNKGNLLSDDGNPTIFDYDTSVSGIISIYESRNAIQTGIYTDDDVFTTIIFDSLIDGISNLNLNNVIWVNSTIGGSGAETIIPNIVGGNVNINPAPGIPPVLSNVECDLGSGFVNCNTIVYEDTIFSIQATCTDSDGTVDNVRFVLSNTQDGIDLIDDTDTSGSVNVYSISPNYLIEDSGNMILTVTCIDDDLDSDVNITNWQIPFGSLNAIWISPVAELNVTQNQFTSFTTQVSCVGGECGDVEATLDPPDWVGIDSSYLYDYCGDYSSGYTLGGALDGNQIWYHLQHSPADGDHHWFILDLKDSYNVTKIQGKSLQSEDPIKVDIYVSDILYDWGVPIATDLLFKDLSNWNVVDTISKVGRYLLVNITETEIKGTIDTGAITWGNENFPYYIFDVYGELMDPTYKGAVSTLEGDTPFYTIDANPNTTDCVNMKAGNSCSSSWSVNATGSLGEVYQFYTIYTPTQYASVSEVQTSHIYVKINASGFIPTCIDSDGDGYNTTASAECGVVADCQDDPDGADGIPGNADDGENINPGQTEICDNGIDDNCNNECEYDASVCSHGDATCNIGVYRILASDGTPDENTIVQILCQIAPFEAIGITSVNADLDGVGCTFNRWNSNFMVFDCLTGSPGLKTARCAVDTLKSYSGFPDTFEEMTMQIDVQFALDYDLNGDGYVNVGDMSIVAMSFGSSGCVSPSWCNGRDFNRDGNVNIVDLSLVGLNFRG